MDERSEGLITKSIEQGERQTYHSPQLIKLGSIGSIVQCMSTVGGDGGVVDADCTAS